MSIIIKNIIFLPFYSKSLVLKAPQSSRAADAPYTKEIGTTAMHVRSCKGAHHRCHRKQEVLSVRLFELFEA